MSLAVRDDYFSFISNKLGGSAVQREPAAAVQRVKVMGRPDMDERALQSQMEVTESALSDTAIERIFRPPNA